MVDTDNLKSKTLSSLVWQFLQKIFGQLFSFIVTVILARLLMPSDYGVVALASMFNVLVGIFISGSMDAALIQKKDADELDYNTVFFSSLFMSFIIYGVVFFCAPLFASIYHNEMITPVMRVLALTMPIGALSMVQNATISRNLDFKKFFYATLIGQIVAAIVGIAMAYKGFGPWALVAQTIIGSVTNTSVTFVLVSWHPKFMFSWERFRILFDFAWKKTVAGFIGTLCAQLKGYIIGYKYTTADLAFLNRGDGLPDMFMNNINGSINAVLFPALSRINEDVVAVKRGIRRSMMTSSYVLCPILFGLAAMANHIVPVLYSDKWIPAVPFMQVSCINACVCVLNSPNLDALYALGKTDEVLKLEIYKKPMLILILIIAMFISPLAIAVGMLVYSLYVFCVNIIPNKKYLNYSVSEQLNDVKPAISLSLIMSIFIFAIGKIHINIYLLMSIQVLSGISIYILLSHLLKLESYLYIKNTLKELIANKFLFNFKRNYE